MLFYEISNFCNLPVIENAAILENGVTIALDEELGRAAFGEFAVAGMNVHALHHTEGSEIQIIACYLEIII